MFLLDSRGEVVRRCWFPIQVPSTSYIPFNVSQLVNPWFEETQNVPQSTREQDHRQGGQELPCHVGNVAKTFETSLPTLSRRCERRVQSFVDHEVQGLLHPAVWVGQEACDLI